MKTLFQLNKGEIQYAVEYVRPWWRFWRTERMWKDQADHEWTIWNMASSQGNKKKLLIKLESCFSVGVYVILFPVFSWLTKRFLKDYSLILNVNVGNNYFKK